MIKYFQINVAWLKNNENTVENLRANLEVVLADL